MRRLPLRMLLALLAAVGSASLRAQAARRTPAPTPVEEVLDIPSESEISKALQTPGSPEGLRALDKVLAAAAVSRDARKWTATLVREVRHVLGPWYVTVEKRLVPNDQYDAAERLVAAVKPPSVPAFEVARLIVLADVGERGARIARNGESLDQARAARRSRTAAEAWERAWAMREALGDSPRAALGFDDYRFPGHDTARDVLTYLFAQSLEERAAADESALGGSPLERAEAALRDLEEWHTAKRRRADAFEARLERLRVLFWNRADAAPRAAVVEELRRALPAVRDIAVWSTGMAQLAIFVNETAPTPDEALALARAGAEAHPGSAGASRSAAVAAVLRLELEDPEATVYAVPAAYPGGDLFAVLHRGAAVLRFSALRLEADDLFENRWAALLTGSGAARKECLDPAACADSVSWSASLPPSRNRELTTTRLGGPLPAGVFRVAARLDPGGTEAPRPMTVVVSELALVLSGDDETLVARTISTRTGNPVRGAEVRLYRNGRDGTSTLIASALSDSGGIARFPRPRRSSPADSSAVVTARRGADVARAFVREGRPRDSRPPATIAVDRALADPGETVRWRAIVGRRERDGPPSAPLVLAARDSRENLLASWPVPVGGLGTAAGELALPELPAAGPGSWRLVLDAGPPAAKTSFPYEPLASVSLSRREPPRPLDVSFDTLPDLLPGEAAHIRGTVLRNGAPVAKAEVSWRALAGAVPRPSANRRVEPGSFVTEREVLASGKAFADERGRFTVSVSWPRTAKEDWNISFEATAASEARSATVSAPLRALVGARRPELPGNLVLDAGERRRVLVRLTLPLGQVPVAGRSVLRVFRQDLADAAPPELPADVSGSDVSYSQGFPPLPSVEQQLGRLPQGPEVVAIPLEHDAAGEARATLPALPRGLYRVVAEAEDRAGRIVRSTRWAVVDAEHVRLPVLLGFLEDAGETGSRRFFVQAAPTAPAFLELERPGRPLETRTVTASSVVELANEPGPVAVRLFAIESGRLLVRQRGFERRAPDLVLRVVRRTPRIEVRVEAEDGRPVAGAEVSVASSTGAWGAGGLDARRLDRRPFFATEVSSSIVPGRAELLRPLSASEWGRTRAPEDRRERMPLWSESLGAFCGTGMPPPPRPRLTAGRPPSQARPMAIPAIAPPAGAPLWAPSIRTDVRGIAEVPFAWPEGPSFRFVTLAALAPNGRAGFLVLPAGAEP